MEIRTVFDFKKDSSLQNWYVVDDVVMGGRSSGGLSINDEGFGVFAGRVSLENNGGFSSIRHRFDRLPVEEQDYLVIKLKGDGEKYQLRVKHDARSYYSYIASFTSSGEWEQIEVPLSKMYPSFRGRRLDRPDFLHESIEEIAILIGNKEEQEFQLIIDKIELVSQ